MAKQTQNSADGFINISVIDANGNPHQVGGIALSENRATHAAILEKAAKAEDAGEDLVLNLTCTVKLMGDEPVAIVL